MNNTARRAAAALALIGTGLAAAACSSEEDTTLTVCTNVPFEPFEFQEDGEYVGFDIDLMNLLGERLDQTVEIVEIDFDSIASGSALNAGTCDIAASGLTITEERQEAMGMSQAYYRADQALVVGADSATASIEDLAEMRVAVQTGSTGEAYANDNAGQFGYEVVAFETMGDIASALTSGSVDASIADLATWTAMIESAPDLKLVQTIETEEYYGFAVQKDDTALLDEVNAMLDEAFENGTYEELYLKWIGEPYTGNLDQQ
ncbi:transporter substrate-binding domain-containing protein [Glycomyces sp. TRM65418]|uniref:transporter substrate-binding domain-containing protein n=1 Tax=Glycomyces sp. TRM65418 TaxID=2867006 RepID=UPI001CE4C076|nr:transporter substrate-binding domain-containing protein [Glycomyces sp. TRM65418]MCC3763042.1 transporter substrate-binding domain-containing protein [Glycomyces sp. TRM65418]QZD57056.1 transporter substrate-binding domain-containing protein [Glycomyces sp. TRM65418]